MAVMREQIMQEAMDVSNIQAPLAMRMAEHIPGIATSIGFSSGRGSNTLMRGGYMDYKYAKGSRMANKFRVMDQTGALSARNKANFVGGGRIAGGRGILGRRASTLGGPGVSNGFMGSMMGSSPTQKAGFLRGSRLNNITARPRAFGRLHSTSTFTGPGAYTPFGASGFIGNTKMGRKIAANAGVTPAAGESAFGPGLLSFISAGRKTDLLERRAMGGSSRALKKLGIVDRNISSLAKINNPAMFKSNLLQTATNLGNANGRRYIGMSGMTAQQRLAIARGANPAIINSTMAHAGSNMVRVGAGGAMVGDVGVRGNMMASSMYGGGSRYMAGYFRGAGGFAGKAGLQGEALKGANKAVAHMAEALGQKQIAGKAGLQAASHVLENGAFKTLGRSGVMEALGSKAGMKVLGARAAQLAIPGLNVIAAASLVYDLGKMAGEVVKSGINLAKDAGKSLQGDIYKPSFGMGYKDTEAAATSRSRGVMAIQNSRLNARSMLGSEGAMMAAHYG